MSAGDGIDSENSVSVLVVIAREENGDTAAFFAPMVLQLTKKKLDSIASNASRAFQEGAETIVKLALKANNVLTVLVDAVVVNAIGEIGNQSKASHDSRAITATVAVDTCRDGAENAGKRDERGSEAHLD